MSREVFEIVRGMDKNNLENQLALQCAPLLMGVKISNLLIIKKSNLLKVKNLLEGTDISYYGLLIDNSSITLLLYRKGLLVDYLSTNESRRLLEEMGYTENNLLYMLYRFKRRYEIYMKDNMEFPHEMGLFLGYPVDDVEGFIKNDGQNYIYTGYWKVYANLSEKLRIFKAYEEARERLVQMVALGTNIAEVI